MGASNGGGRREQDTTRNGNRRATDTSGATATGPTASSHRPSEDNVDAGGNNAGDDRANSCGRERDAAGVGTDTVATGTGSIGKGKETGPSEDNAGGIDGPRREAALLARSGDPQERGTKRFSEVELDGATVGAVGGGAGARGVVGRARGKVPRGRNLTAPAAPLVAADPAGLAAVEGEGGAGSNRARTRGRSPM